MTFVRIALSIIAYFLLFLLTAFVFLYGERDTGIKEDYIITAIMLLLMIGGSL